MSKQNENTKKRILSQNNEGWGRHCKQNPEISTFMKKRPVVVATSTNSTMCANREGCEKAAEYMEMPMHK
jgi:hypothetical protein